MVDEPPKGYRLAGPPAPGPARAAPPRRESEGKVNPWRALWLHPRKTIKHIVSFDPRHRVLLIYCGATLLNTLMVFVPVYFLFQHPTLQQLMAELSTNAWFSSQWLWGLVIPGTLLGQFLVLVIVLFYLSWAYRWAGVLLGGQGKNIEIRAAMAWSYVPIACGMLLSTTIGLVIGWQAFGQLGPLIEIVAAGGTIGPEAFTTTDSLTMTIVNIAAGVASFFLVIWSLVLFCHMLGQVHAFSAWKGLFTVGIGNFFAVMPIVALGLALSLVAGQLAPRPARGHASLSSVLTSLSLKKSAAPPAATSLLPVAQPTQRNPAKAVAALRDIHKAMEAFRADAGIYPTIDLLVYTDPPYLKTSRLEVVISPPYYLSTGGYFIMQYETPTTDAYCVEARSAAEEIPLDKLSIDATGVVRRYPQPAIGATWSGCAGTVAMTGGDLVE